MTREIESCENDEEDELTRVRDGCDGGRRDALDIGLCQEAVQVSAARLPLVTVSHVHQDAGGPDIPKCRLLGTSRGLLCRQSAPSPPLVLQTIHTRPGHE